MFNTDQLEIGQVWQVSGVIAEIKNINDGYVYFDNWLSPIFLENIRYGNYMELKIN